VRSSPPPALAVWLLERFSGNNALVGDLVEAFGAQRSTLWFWKQTMVALLVIHAGALLALTGLVALFAIGRRIAIPGVNADALAALASGTGGTFRVYDVLSGGSLARGSVLALAIHPYTTAATAVELGAWLRRRASGRITGSKWIVRGTRMLAIIVAGTQALGLTLFLERQSQVPGGLALVGHSGWTFRIPAILALTCSTLFLMMISDRLSKAGTANGLLLVFAAGAFVGLFPARSIGVVPQLAMNLAIVWITSQAYRRDLCAFAR